MTYGTVREKWGSFCFRLSRSWKDAYQKLEQKDDVDWSMASRSKKGHDKLRTYHLPTQLEGLRLVSIQLPSGEKEVLVTNLKREDYNLQDLKKIISSALGSSRKLQDLQENTAY